MTCQERIEGYLHEHQIPYQVQRHPRAFTAQEIAESEHISGKMVAKSVMLVTDGKKVMMALPASYQVDIARARAALGSEDARLARESEFAADFPDCQVGAMPPFGNLYNLPVYVDASLAEDDTIVFPVGTYTDTMSVRYADFERLVHPTKVDVARHG